jgi:MFS family permease
MAASRLSPAGLVAILGATQIIGYGTLYYGFAILAADMAAELGWPVATLFGVFSAALLVGGLAAPAVGRAIDRHGAGPVLAAGSPAAAAALAVTALAPGGVTFVLGVAAMQLASALVLYDAAFAALVQAGGRHARRHITHLTLIAGFASTIFWPLTAWLDAVLDWRGVLLAYGGMNLLVCLPLHLVIARRAGRASGDGAEPEPAAPAEAPLPAPLRRRGFLLAAAGFALLGFLLSAVLAQMVPML